MDATERNRFIAEALAFYRRATLERILALIPDKEPKRYLYDLMRDYVRRDSKGLRPALCIATCVAFGGSMERAIDSAAAIELFHNAALAHDDVEDGSALRRGEPTLNAELGEALAMNAGDALNVLAMRSLFGNAGAMDSQQFKQLLQEFSLMTMETVEGQALELGWIRDNVVGLGQDDYIRLVLKKTCCYTSIYPLRIGALLSEAIRLKTDSFFDLGLYMGAVFQIRDDWLSLRGAQEKFGKSILGDIREGKRTLMLMHMLDHCCADDRMWISSFFQSPRAVRSDADVHRIFALMEGLGSLTYAEDVCRHFLDRAHSEFSVAFAQAPDSYAKKFVRELITYLGERET